VRKTSIVKIAPFGAVRQGLLIPEKNGIVVDIRLCRFSFSLASDSTNAVIEN